MLIFWQSCFMIPKKVYKDINSLFRRFFWTGIDLQTKRGAIAWDKVCRPYEEGGMAIRDPYTTSTAAGLRHIWDLATNKPTIWVVWVQKHLIRGRDMWTISTPNDCSWSWRKILELRPVTRDKILHLIGDGSSTRFWKDNWHPIGVLEDKFPMELMYDSILPKSATINAILTEGKWIVPEHIKQSIEDNSAELNNVEIHGESADTIVWRLDKADASRKFVDNWVYTASFVLPKVLYCSWESPLHGYAMMNSDGGLNNKGAGYGALLRDCEGRVFATAAGNGGERPS